MISAYKIYQVGKYMSEVSLPYYFEPVEMSKEHVEECGKLSVT